MKKIRLAVIGSRSFEDEGRLCKILDANIEIIEMIISGGAKGADNLTHEWCKKKGVPILIYYPKWYDETGTFHRGAGFKRNYYIVSAADRILCFWDGASKGTANSLEIAKQLNKPVKLIKFIASKPAAGTDSDTMGSLE